MRLSRQRCLVLGAVLIATIVASSPAHALEGVVATIKPVHSLVAAVMDGIGEPALIVRGGGSEHAHSLRPSDATVLENATVIFRIGEGMETFLNAPLKTLAPAATIISLEDTPGLTKHDFREGGPFEAHAHDDEHDHGHDSADGHNHNHNHDHDHEAHDLHIWLDPVNAEAMLRYIAQVLADTDPRNAPHYQSNAQAYSARLGKLVSEIEAIVEPARQQPAVVFHDAYQYFEVRFGVNVVGSITVNPEVAPGAQRLSEIRDKVRDTNAVCVFSEPQFQPRSVSVVIENTQARTAVLDPLGAEIEDGPELYFTLMRNLATAYADCLSGKG